MTNSPQKHLLTVNVGSGLRLDRWVAEQCPEITRTRLQVWIGDGLVLVNGLPAKPSVRLKIGDVVSLNPPLPEPSPLTPEAVPLDILYEDACLLVVNKPPGMVVHPAPGHRCSTLVHALLHHCSGELSGVGGVERPGIVHRLDKDTSGAILVAKTDAAHQSLCRQFKGREVKKIYRALVSGAPKIVSGKIEQPVGRHPLHRQKMAVVSSGRSATTLYRVVEKGAAASFMECEILTGRTHQIRVHMAWLGCPVLGDSVYGKKNTRYAAERQMLHAAHLSFIHPETQKRLEFLAPLPDDFKKLLAEILKT